MVCLSSGENLLILLVLGASLLSIFCRYRSESLYRLAKPIPLFLIIGFYLCRLARVPESSFFAVVMLLGLAGGVTGDILLLFPRGFLPGLAAFLAGHIFYILGFTAARPGISLLVLAPVLLLTLSFAALLLRRMEPSRRKTYSVPILLYVTAIALLFATALGYERGGDSHPPWFTTGALLFGISDGILAWNRFARPFPSAQFLILSTYYTAQILIGFKAIRLLG